MVARGSSFVITLLSFFFAYAFLGSSAKLLKKHKARATPPAGALVVSKTPGNGQYSTVQAAVNALPNDGSPQTIFIKAGIYEEQVYIDRKGMLTIKGETVDNSTYVSNVVTITHSVSAKTAGSDDATGTLRVHKDDFALYNVNVKNTFGKANEDGQALALSAYGKRHGYYMSGFFGYQDTVLVQEGFQYFGYCYIEGAVDFIFGQHAHTFFQKSTIASIGHGCITASGPKSKADSLFVINKSTIKQGSAATKDLTGLVYLGRPWSKYANVAFTSCSLSSIINSAGWSVWQPSDQRTEDVTFAEYGNTGAGAQGTRASFARNLTSTAGYTAADVLGGDWTTWVNQGYF